MKKLIFGFVSLLFVIPCQAGTIIVDDDLPADFNNIQAAINNSNNGDIIEVQPGIYTGVGNRNIDFKGKAITVCSTDPGSPEIVGGTVIDCETLSCGFVFRGGEDANSVIAGLTIISGKSIFGGAINCHNRSSPTINNCVITANSATFGGAIACGGSSRPVISNCIISGNSAAVGGGAIYCNAGSPTISSSILSGNVAPSGGAINSTISAPVIRNCTFTGNDASNGGTIYCYNSSSVTLENSILWADTADNGHELFVSKSGSVSSLTASYCDVQGGQSAAIVQEGCTLNWGDDNISTDPCFVQPGYWNASGLWVEGDYHLSEDSLCINAGNPNFTPELNETDIDGQPRVIDGRVDIGADEYFTTTISARLDIYPGTLNLASKARWIKCHIRLPEDYNVADIDLASILLEDEIEPQWLSVDEQEQVVMARFSCSEVQDILNPPMADEVWLTIRGELTDGTSFEGTDVIRVIDKGGKPAK